GTGTGSVSPPVAVAGPHPAADPGDQAPAAQQPGAGGGDRGGARQEPAAGSALRRRRRNGDRPRGPRDRRRPARSAGLRRARRPGRGSARHRLARRRARYGQRLRPRWLVRRRLRLRPASDLRYPAVRAPHGAAARPRRCASARGRGHHPRAGGNRLPPDAPAYHRGGGRRQSARSAGRLGAGAILRPGRHRRPQPGGMPGAAGPGRGPLRSGDGAADRQPRPPRPRPDGGAQAHLRRRRRRPRRHGPGAPRLRPQTRRPIRVRAGDGARARRADHPHPRRLGGRAQQRNPAAGADQPPLPPRTQDRRAGQAGPRLFGRLPAERQLAGPRARPACPDHRQGRQRDRPPAGRLLPRRRAGAEATDPRQGRGRDRHARVHRQPGHQQQISAVRARAVRTQIFLPLGRGGGQRRGRVGRGGQGGDRQAYCRRDGGAERRHAGRSLESPGLRPRPADGRQVPRSAGHRELNPAAAPTGDCGKGGL
ncbi:MAG: RNA polymerase sigma-54 factor RpoN, partial [uncultured Sphingomonas sp.]